MDNRGRAMLDNPNQSLFNPTHWVPNDALSVLSGTRDQYELQREQQEFDEYMYNAYNSPEALVRQYREAGVNTNLLGSTSFGTAQSSAGAPAVNSPAAALGEVAGVANKIAGAASLAADPALKASQIAVNMTLPALNTALTDKYGSEARFTDIQYESANQLLEWSRQDRECTAMTLRLGYFQALQNKRNSEQEFENMVKEGKVLDNEIEYKKWQSQIEKETYDILIKHHYLPDMDFLNRIYIDYIENGDTKGFNKYVNGFTMLEDSRNRSSARFGANGGNLRIGGFEITPQMLEYIQQSGRDLYDVITDLKSGKKGDSFLDGLFSSDKSDDKPVDKPEYSEKQIKRFNTMDDIIRSVSKSNPDTPMDSKEVTNILRREGYSWKHIGEYLEYRGY